ncbi:pyruvate/2-oxoglutarate dehydrogenase complex dihydrolipoamide acyltransferase (E2) component [Prauserella isguenensis]|uniref:Pyruvate/2-oxoglutarate dehydrogenase complex dihydrolipoamide acyltransferase (E2) component n=1 Tax=Prauserella isguenensis TaxID=1470180 RepID=A0A839S0M3_9PSEU|nr:DUF1992 domain-containing protein [Prauserella isguenensis]MBB3051135.1 pyruvate/2-oxoglutarate dehydrogenase complex dihydrolipoamide acyltransferase (E2) component [Prauserella isguenensis]
MTERKPPGVDFESWVEKQIREAQERGEFDALPGAGKPLTGLDRDWLSTYIEREGLSIDAALPEPLRLRKEIENLPSAAAALRSEEEVRDLVRELNLRIAAWIRSGEGPRIRLKPVAVDDVLDEWRRARGRAQRADVDASPGTPGEGPPSEEPRAGARRRRWWRRRRD